MPFKATHGIPSPAWGCGHAPGKPSLGCWLRQSLPAAHPRGCSHHPAPSGLFVWMMCPALMTKIALYRLSKYLALAAMSNSGTAVIAQGAPAEHPRVTRALSGKTLMPGSEGGRERLSLARDTEMPSDSGGAT